jgi:lysophospholipase L1-like esterase
VHDRAKNAALVFGSVVVSLLVFGGGFELRERTRYAAWRQERTAELAHGSVVVPSTNPGLIWENRPHVISRGFTTNRWGFRDVDYPKEKPADVYRVAFVGDSVTLGSGTSHDMLFVSLIGQRALRLAGPRHVQAMNFSVSGYNALQIGELVRARVLGFSPDEVIYVFCLNDFDFDDASGQLIHYFRPPASFLWERLTEIRVDPGVVAYHEHYFAKNHDEVFAAILRTARLLDERHVGFRVAVLPVFDFALQSFREYQVSDVHDSIIRFLGQNHISGVDLLPTFRDCSKRPPSAYAKDVWHLNGLGHRFVAQALFEAVLSEYPHEPKQTPAEVCAVLRDLEPDENADERRALATALTGERPVRLPVDSSLLSLEQFWPIEQAERGAFAWSRDRSVVRISRLTPGGIYRVRLEIADSASRAVVLVGALGGALTKVPLRDSNADVSGVVTANESGDVALELRAETWKPSARGASDTRELGVALDAVEIRHER